MKTLRIVLTQNKAHYRKEETVENKMTYPLPPFSTVIGALHNACGFKEYKPMDLSIQGRYKSLSKQAYTDYCFLDSLGLDRNILIKLKNTKLMSKAFEKVAIAPNQSASLIKDKNVNVINRELYTEFRYFIDKYKSKQAFVKEINKYKKQRVKLFKDTKKRRVQNLKKKFKHCDKLSDDYQEIRKRVNEIEEYEVNKDSIRRIPKELLNDIEFLNYELLVTSLNYYEILHEVKLIIHVNSEKDVLNSIHENIYNLKAIGRSEDFVDVKECSFVELIKDIEYEVKSEYSAYLNYDLVKDEHILLNRKSSGIPASGTKYWINKVYYRDKGFREFEKVKVVYASNYSIDNFSKNVFLDKDGKYIVNFN